MNDKAGDSPQFKRLFSPLDIGKFSVRNRILSTAHVPGYAENGLPTDRHLHYWTSKAKGGIGLIITEGSLVHPSTFTPLNFIELWKDEVISPFGRIVDAVHEHGTRIVAQLNHMGMGWTPSGVANSAGERTHEMTQEEIEVVVQAFASSAYRMRVAGLDGVELHGAHGYLIEQFMSPLTNRRQDDYGGDEERRLRFLRETIAAVRKEVGRDFTVGLRIDGDQFKEGGLTQEDVQRIVGKLTAEGGLDFLNVSLLTSTKFGPATTSIVPMYVPPGQFVYLAAGIKQVTPLPVFCICRITNPVLAEEILVRAEADMVGMTRANIADPELPNKAQEGRLDEIRYCIGINEGCIGRITQGVPITCALNPSVGRELESEITPAPVTKRVMVVGGGIAGMEAARVAAARGHQVSLYEKEPVLGGQLQIAAKAPGRSDMAEPVRYFSRMFDLLGVRVSLGTVVDEAIVMREDPDAVIVATGATASFPEVEGLSAGTDGLQVVLARDVLSGTAGPIGDRVVVFATDQGMEPLTTADFLASRGKRVEFLVPYPEVGSLVESQTRPFILDRLLNQGVVLSVMTAVKGLRDGKIIVHNPPVGKERVLDDVDTLVLGAGSQSDDGLWKAIRHRVKEVYAIGDCVAPRRIVAATQDALTVGLAI